MSTSLTNPASFTGSSAFSTQLAQVISNAVTAASAPVNQLDSQQTNLQNQQSELNTLSTDFGNLQSAIDSINSAAGANAYSANVSDTSVASASVSSGVMAGSYLLNVTSVGSSTNTMSMNGLTTVTNPSSGNIDASSTYTLSVNGTNYPISDADGSLNGLANAINASGANVQATVVNVGSNSSPDYRLSVQSLDYAPDTIQLSDGTTNLLSTISTGSYVQYQVNGQPSTPINSDSRSLTLSPGLSVDVLGVGTTNVNVTQDVSGIGDALNSFVTAYNALSGELSKNRGQNGGALSGESIVYELQNALNSIADYTTSGNLNSLADLGITFDQNGNLTFNQSTFDQASTNDVVNFFGSESSSGFLQAANNLMSSVTNSSTGILTEETQSMTNQLSSIGTQITADQAQVTQLQQTLTEQMSAADATISSLEQQVSEITDLFTTTQAQEFSAVNG